jgi:adenylate kinase
MRLILLGPPGGGKGTQAKLLEQRLKLRHISTGDILRQAIAEGTPAGKRAQPFLANGQLAPDDLVNELVRELFERADRPDRFVTDGYPRSAAQAACFERILRAQALPLDAVILLDVEDEEIVRRTAGRWVCPNKDCKATYHTKAKPPRRPGVCDLCGTPLVQREDDREETVRRRLLVYHQTHDALVGYYQAQGLLRQVPGTGEVEAIYQSILEALTPARPSA